MTDALERGFEDRGAWDEATTGSAGEIWWRAFRPYSRVLVTGGAGYLGSIVVRTLLKRGYRVRVLDSLRAGDAGLRGLRGADDLELLRGDVRDLVSVVRGARNADAVVHLAAIDGARACRADEALAFSTNAAATRMLADVARGLGIARFVFASTTLIYGSGAGSVDEHAPPRPGSLYARTKVDGERALATRASDGFRPTILRLGPLYGLSPRPRPDLDVNRMVMRAVRDGHITASPAGVPLPLLHVRDCADAIVLALEAPPEIAGGETFNVGSDAADVTPGAIAETIQDLRPEVRLRFAAASLVRPESHVSCAKIRERLGFTPKVGIREGLDEMLRAPVEAESPAAAAEASATRRRAAH